MAQKLTIEIIKATAESKGLVLISTEYINTTTPIIVECSIHGRFEMLPKKIRKNKGCRKCAHKGVNRENCRSVEEVRELAKSKGFELISSPNPESIARLEKITLNCSKHGEFTVLLGSLIDRPKVCRACGYGEVRRKMLIPDEILTSMASEVKSQFVKSGVRNNKRRFVLLNCPDHGEFKKFPSELMDGEGCPKCGQKQRGQDSKTSLEDLKKILDPLGYELLGDFEGLNYKTLLRCPKHGEFSMRIQSIQTGHRCKKCGNGESKPQTDIFNLIKTLYPDAEEDCRKIISPKELDVFVPSKNFAIEYCGLYWHSEIYKDKKYHKNKLDLCTQKGISLLTIFEDEWQNRRPQVENFIKAKLGALPKLNGRDCTIDLVPKLEARDFMNKHHIQGSTVHLVAFGLYHPKHGLVALMTGGKHHRGGSALVLNRLCLGEFSVRGGASKLLKALANWAISNNYREILTWSDNRWSSGGVYRAMGFEFAENLPADYSYVKDQDRFSKQSCTKKALLKKGRSRKYRA